MAQIVIKNSLTPANAGGVSIVIRVPQEELSPAERRTLATRLAADARFELRNLGISLDKIEIDDTFDERRLDL